jgi:hypothetical protein
MGNYADGKNLSVYWHNKSSDLHAGAGVTWHALNNDDSNDFSSLGFGVGFRMGAALPIVYRMLCGMSIELALKAIVVEKGGEPKLTHNLNELARTAGVSYTKEQSKLLEILTEAIYWHGKYPVPTKENDWNRTIDLTREHLFDQEELGNSGLMVYRGNSALDWESYVELRGVAMRELIEIASWITR